MLGFRSLNSIRSGGYGTVRTKTSSSWDDSHKRDFFYWDDSPETIRTNGKKWNKKFLIENFKLQ